MIFSQFSSRLLSCFERCISFRCRRGMRDSGIFQSFIHLELKPEAIPPWERISELGTIPIGLLSRATCFRYGTFCVTGFICFCCNGDDSICTKTIKVCIQFFSEFWIASSFIWRWWQYQLLILLMQNKLVFQLEHHREFFSHNLISWFLTSVLLPFFSGFPICLFDFLQQWPSQNSLQDFIYFWEKYYFTLLSLYDKFKSLSKFPLGATKESSHSFLVKDIYFKN